MPVGRTHARQDTRDRVLADLSVLLTVSPPPAGGQPFLQTNIDGPLQTCPRSPKLKSWTHGHPPRITASTYFQLTRGSSPSIEVAIPRRWETPKSPTTISFIKHLCAGGCSDDVVRSRAIDKELKVDERKAAREVKLLLLGQYTAALSQDLMRLY